MVLVKIIIFIVFFALGIFFMVRTENIVRTIGHNSLAEKYLGPGGSYLMWRIIGTIVILMGFLFLVGRLDRFLGID